MAGGALLSFLLLAAIGIDEWPPWPHESTRTILAVRSVVTAVAGLTGLVSLGLGSGPNSRLLPRRWDRLPAAMFSPPPFFVRLHNLRTQLEAPAVVALTLNSASYMIVLVAACRSEEAASPGRYAGAKTNGPQGVAAHPAAAAGRSVQHLLECADQQRYAQKASGGRKAHSREF